MPSKKEDGIDLNPIAKSLIKQYNLAKIWGRTKVERCPARDKLKN